MTEDLEKALILVADPPVPEGFNAEPEPRWLLLIVPQEQLLI